MSRSQSSALPFAVAAGVGLVLAALVMWSGTDSPVPAPAPTTPLATASAAPLASSAPLASPSVTPPVASPAPVASEDALCPLGMRLVSGRYCPFVAHRCLEWAGARPERRRDEARARCARYEDRLLCEGRPSEHAFCVDRYEYPNLPSMKPAVMVSYRQARGACAEEGKRLCAADEWRLACEGQQTRPYPTGLTREPSLCNIDRRPRQPDPVALAEPHDVSVEVERLDQRMPSGALAECVSPFGLFGMSGNVAEWVHDRAAGDDAIYDSALAGGHWGRSPATCRELDHQHPTRFLAHYAGFRCCADPLDRRAVRRLMPKGFRLPKRRAILAPVEE